MRLTKDNKIGTMVLLVFFAVIMYITMKAYLGMFFLALIVVIVMYPFYKWIQKKIKSKAWSSIIASFVFLLVIIVPFAIFIMYTINETSEYFATSEITQEEKMEAVTQFEQNHPEIVVFLDTVQIDPNQTLSSAMHMLNSFFSNIVVPFSTSVVMFFVDLTFFMLILIYLFPDKKTFFNVLVEVIPLDSDLSERFINRFVAVTQKMVISVFLAAMTQGILGGIMFYILGIPIAGFWTVVMTFAALLPLGSGLVWVPVGLFLILTGNIVDGIILLLWGMIVISSADNVVRGWLLKGGKTQIPEIITFISALGGIVAFGFFGFIYGPVIAAGFLTALDLYREYRRDAEKAALKKVTGKKATE